jgi:SMC interacting uncharacterized protein involved in chromosome segregation
LKLISRAYLRERMGAMPLRMIAKDLYRLQQEVEKLENQLETLPYDQREDLKEQLRKARAERDRMRKILDGNKEPPAYRKPL